jgi:hypothetical protein
VKLPAITACEIADYPAGTDLRPYPDMPRLDVIENRHTGKETRWTSIHELVVKDDDGRLWCAMYEAGLTECQDVSPFDEYTSGVDNGEAEFWEVRRKVVETYVYEPLPT